MTQPPDPAGKPAPGGFPPPPAPVGFPPPPGGYPPPGWGNPPPGAHYPPPPGNYPPPPPGGYPPPGNYPPPPPGGYPPQGGYPPPPPADGGYVPPPPGHGRPAYSVGEGLSWAWNKFAKNAVPLLVATLVYGVLLIAVMGLFGWLLNMVSPETVIAYQSADEITEFITPGDSAAGAGISILGWIVFALLGGVIAAAYYAGLLDIADGRPVTVGSFFRPRKVVSVVVAALIVGLVSAVVTFPALLVPYAGALLAFLLTAVVSTFVLFTTVVIVDRNLSPVEGIRQSIGIVRGRFGESALVWLISEALLFIGAFLCGVGLLVSAPLAFLLIVYSYRKLSGAQVAPATA